MVKCIPSVSLDKMRKNSYDILILFSDQTIIRFRPPHTWQTGRMEGIMVTGSKELIRDMNRHLILAEIINKGPLSRAAIAKESGLTKATVSAIVQTLLDEQLVTEIGSDDTSRGRKPILLSFCQEAGCILSVDLGVDHITALTADLKGEHCRLRQYPNHFKREQLTEGLLTIMESSMRELPPSPYGVVGISIGIHGVVHHNHISFTPYYDYAGLDLAAAVSSRFSIPVILENEANLSIIGEKAFCYNYPNMAGISVHSGVGMGLIVDGKLYTGCSGCAGEFGHTIVEADGRPCPCGNHGCLEQYASERALLQEYVRRKGLSHISAETFMDACAKSDPDAVLLLEQFVKYMSIGINNILNVFNPDVIVINSAFTVYSKEIMKQLENRLENRMRRYCRILPSGLQDSSILLGGIYLSTRNFLGIDELQLKSVI